MLLADRISVPAGRLARHPFDTLLAVLVAALGVALIVCLAALVKGLQLIGQEAMRKGGAYVVRVEKKGLGVDDLAAFADVRPSPLRIAPVGGYPCAVSYSGRSAPGLLMATIPESLAMYGLEVERGASLPAAAGSGELPGCVLDGGIAGELFGDADPLGRTVRAAFGERVVEAEVLGVLPDLNLRAPLGLGGKIPSRTVYVHQDAVLEQTQGKVHTILIEAGDSADVAPLVSSVHLRAEARWPEERFKVKHRLKQVREVRKFKTMIEGLGVALALTTLLSCALSISILQLMGLRGRVGEVAVRVIEGATGSTIALQLVVESALTTGLGALLGLPLGWALAEWLATVVQWPVIFELPLAAGALLIATCTGLLAGTLPAWRAAGLDPVQGLKISREAGC